MSNRDRAAAEAWLERHYPLGPEDRVYDPDRALDETDLRAQGLGTADVLAWVMPGQDAAEAYARACAVHWGRPNLGIYVNPDGLVISVTDVRADPDWTLAGE